MGTARQLAVLPGGAYPHLLPDNSLFSKQCRMDAYAASGPGGQKRNRTYSAVRATHTATGISVIAEESRSQTENRNRALKRLKKSIALTVRRDPLEAPPQIHQSLRHLFRSESPQHINPGNRLYPLFCATVLDYLYAAQGRLGDAAGAMGLTSGRLNRLLSRDTDLYGAVNGVRRHFGLRPLKFS